MFEMTKEKLQSLGADITTAEIKQQPLLWQETWEIFQNEKSKIEAFFGKLTKENEKVRVIFTGAGTSAYVGDTIAPYLMRNGDNQHFIFESIPTTNIVSNPDLYLNADIPTVLVSFARSGNSPESVATVALGEQIIKDLKQIIITCAPEGKLAQKAKTDEQSLLLLMPAKSNDQGFAMTGSFSCMSLMALLLFDQQADGDKATWVKKIAELGNSVVAREAIIQKIVDLDFERVIYLGSGSLAGLTREAQLKILELTAGKIATLFDSSMGFRHGPKSFVNDKTLVFDFTSNQAYTRQYDLDILHEIKADEIAKAVWSISVEQKDNFAGDVFSFDVSASEVPDAYLALPYVMFAQTVALLTSVKVGNKPDTPSPTGTVNRVVKGVTIHEY